LYVIGLTREEIKVKLIEHLTKYLSDKTLGLTEIDSKTGKTQKVAPLDSPRVFVEDYADPDSTPSVLANVRQDLDVILGRLNELGNQVRNTRRNATTPSSSPPDAPANGPAPSSPPQSPAAASTPGASLPPGRASSPRIDALERKLDRILEKLSGSAPDSDP
jgi:hypothetical protein